MKTCVLPSRSFAKLSAPMRGLRAGSACATVLLAALWSGQALAQAQECVELGKVFNKRQTVIEQINGFQKKQVTPDIACSAFTRLGQLTADTIKVIEKDGAWCHVPAEILPSLQAQTAQIAEARKNSCGAAEQHRKAQSDAAKTHNPLGGSDSVIGGQIKMPKGAL